MTEFKVGDRVVIRNYEYCGEKKDCYGIVSDVYGDEITCEDWSFGGKYGWVFTNELELVDVEKPITHWQKIIGALEAALDSALENCAYEDAIKLAKMLDEVKKNV